MTLQVSSLRIEIGARVLLAETGSSSETAVSTSLLAPVVARGRPVSGASSAAQESLVNAIAELWPLKFLRLRRSPSRIMR